jgi:hypothetical protein
MLIIMSTNEKLTHWENVLKKYFKYIPSEKFWILNVTKLKRHNIEIYTIGFIILLNTYYNKVSKWLNANLSTNNGGSGV